MWASTVSPDRYQQILENWPHYNSCHFTPILWLALSPQVSSWHLWRDIDWRVQVYTECQTWNCCSWTTTISLARSAILHPHHNCCICFCHTTVSPGLFRALWPQYQIWVWVHPFYWYENWCLTFQGLFMTKNNFVGSIPDTWPVNSNMTTREHSIFYISDTSCRTLMVDICSRAVKQLPFWHITSDIFQFEKAGLSPCGTKSIYGQHWCGEEPREHANTGCFGKQLHWTGAKRHLQSHAVSFFLPAVTGRTR